jgi:DNA-binding XRE family transcriptional regulator
MIKLICKCGRTVEVLGEEAKVRCACGKQMVRVDQVSKLKTLRYQNKMSQQEVCLELDIAKSYLSQLENKQLPITEELRGRFAALYQVSQSEIN